MCLQPLTWAEETRIQVEPRMSLEILKGIPDSCRMDSWVTQAIVRRDRTGTGSKTEAEPLLTHSLCGCL